eukprot:TRINITY_DN4085_c0_g1_i1.p1 TRINITY_DN4085_c0_g1~~TRINITY_DN4085_c0_g1_i1.p1  ORF type:complete len:480 (+),score=96.80 TRINITY_DN4085_c0_g1_i1:911-2350(+)
MEPLKERQLLIVRELGNGAFGKALLVRHATTNVPYVAKEVNLKGMLKRDVDDSRNEVAVMMQLEHPNITKFVSSFEANEKIYTIMEYADGGDLSIRILKQQNTKCLFSEDVITNIFIQICLALKYLHQKRFLHRDIKVQNIFLTSSDIVKLGDFGVSKHVGTVGMARTVCGTYSYFSPEMCKRQAYSNKSDVFALGVVLYEMMTLGKKPFVGKDVPELLTNIAKGNMEPLPSGLPYSAGLVDLLYSLLKLDPSRRPSIPEVLTIPYMQGQLKIFARQAMEKEKYYKTQAQVPLVETPPPSPSPEPKPKKKLLGGLFRKRQSSPQPTAAPSKVDTRVRMDKKKLAGLLSQQPNGYKAELDALSKEGQKAQYTNLEATARDCKHLVNLASSQNMEEGGKKEFFESEEKAQQRGDKMKEYLMLTLGYEKLEMCKQVLEGGHPVDVCTSKLADIVGDSKLVSLLMGDFGASQGPECQDGRFIV